ncbi:hypothetical protein BGZ65_010816, partial [Modicella reniformis]
LSVTKFVEFRSTLALWAKFNACTCIEIRGTAPLGHDTIWGCVKWNGAITA